MLAPDVSAPALATAAAAGADRPSGARPAVVVVYLCAVFGTLSLGMGLVPALLTSYRARFGLSGPETANVQNLKDIGLIVTMVAGPWIMRRLSVPRTTLASMLLALAGCAVSATTGSFGGVLAGAFLYGAAFSLGSLAATTQLYRLPERYRHIAAMFATFGVASFVAPALVGLFAGEGRSPALVHLVYAAALVPLLACGLLMERQERRAGGGARTGPVPATDPVREAPLSRAVLRRWLPDLVVFAALMAGETVVVSWVTSLGQVALHMSLARASVLLAVLWAVYTPVRALGDVLRGRFSALGVIRVGAVLAAAGATLVCFGGAVTVYAGVVVFALGMAPLIPVHQGWVLSRTPTEHHGSANAALGISAAGLTTLAVWLTGLTVDVDTRIPFLVSAVLLLAVAVRCTPFPRLSRNRDTAGTEAGQPWH